MRTAVDPVGLALVSQRQYPQTHLFSPPVGLSGLGSLSGFWSDLWDRGQQAIDEWADSQLSDQGTDAHITAQNQAVSDMAAILDSYHRGVITNAQAQERIQATASGFALFCQRLGYAEALQGTADVSALASRILSDLRAEANTGGVVTTLTTNPWIVGLGILALTMLVRRR